ncbi:MAG: IS1595 family transposase [Alphaproteobacteria bacterium]
MQHFLLSAKGRNLSLKKIYKMGEDAAYDMFRQIRWPETNGEAVCPQCGCFESYNITTRRKFKCKACHHQFSVTSGTILHSRKLDFVDLLAGICLFVTGSKGMSAVQFSRTMDVQYKTAWVWCHKMRECLADETDNATLSGEVEIDGCYVGGTVRPANYKNERLDRRLLGNRSPNRRVVVALRERGGRTLPFVRRMEKEGVELALGLVDEGSTIISDEAPHWDVLEWDYKSERINHSEAYSHDGAHTNWVESYFSRLRKMVSGQHHWVSPKYLYQYAEHAAWLEDHRGETLLDLSKRIVGAAMDAPKSRKFKGYWQRAA